LIDKKHKIQLSKVRIKTPNLDNIFEKWKQSAIRKDEKKWKNNLAQRASVC